MSELALAREFPAVDESDWRALVEKALRGADFDKTLVSETYDCIRIDPLYTRESEDNKGVGKHIAWPERSESSWDIRQRHNQPDPGLVNASILADLEGGASSVALRIAAPEQFGLPATGQALGRALENVFLDFAAIALEPGEAFEAAANALIGTWESRGITDDKASGCFGADPLGALARAGGLTMSLDQAREQAAALATVTRDRFPDVTALMVDGRPYHDGGASEAQELACICATTVAYLRMLEASGLSPHDALGQMSFALASDGDQFLTIAKLRAARALLNKIASVCGADSAARACHLHAETSARMMTGRDLHVNLLRTTVACAAAAMGGADSISVLPYTAALGNEDAFGRRIARNIQIILAEESTLGHVVDPSRGSWHIEKLTHDLAAKAWDIFQDIEAQGGIAEALASGHVQAAIRETADKRAVDIAQARQEITGVSAFPSLLEAAEDRSLQAIPDTLDDPAVSVEPIRLRRPSEPFEILRDAADAHAKETGNPANVFLANLGKPSDYNERSRYARNLFAAAGIESVVADSVGEDNDIETAFRESGAQIACLCSSDPIYQERAEAVARSLKSAGAKHIYLAGRPGEKRNDYRSAGVDTFVHRGTNILEILQDAHGLVGIEKR